MVFEGLGKRLGSVAFSRDGQTLATGDETVHLWETSTGRALRDLVGHTERVWSLDFSPDGQTLASGCDDGTIRLWSYQAGQHLATLTLERPYERMNITGATGLTEAQKRALRALGAIEDTV
jgi:WD40 repeat protein